MPSCVMPIVCPATVRFAARPVTDEPCEVTMTLSVALPVPDPGEIASHGAPLDAVHGQFAPFVVTTIGPLPPAEPYGVPRPEVSTVTLQASGSCDTWNV